MGVITISTFNSVVYLALTYTQVINAVLVLAAIPAVTIIISSLMKVDKTNIFQLVGLFLSIIGIGAIISNADLNKIFSLNFNKGDLWMLVCVLSWSLYSTLLKKHNFKYDLVIKSRADLIFFKPLRFDQITTAIGLIKNFHLKI